MSDVQGINTHFEKAPRKRETSVKAPLITTSEPDAVGCDPGEKYILYYIF